METMGTNGCENPAKLGFGEPIAALRWLGAAYALQPRPTLESDAASDYNRRMAERRTTIVARDEDLALLQHEARVQGLSLGRMLGEVVARRADELRQDRRPRLGTFNSDQSIADAATRDNPAARPFRTA